MKKLLTLFGLLILSVVVVGCGQPKESYKNVSFNSPAGFVRADTAEAAFFYDNSSENFTSNLSVYIVELADYTNVKSGAEEITAYINEMGQTKGVSGLVEHKVKVSGKEGKVITYYYDYGESGDPSFEGWGVTYFTEALIPGEGKIYYFEFESKDSTTNKDAFTKFLKSVKIKD